MWRQGALAGQPDPSHTTKEIIMKLRQISFLPRHKGGRSKLAQETIPTYSAGQYKQCGHDDINTDTGNVAVAQYIDMWFLELNSSIT